MSMVIIGSSARVTFHFTGASGGVLNGDVLLLNAAKPPLDGSFAAVGPVGVVGNADLRKPGIDGAPNVGAAVASVFGVSNFLNALPNAEPDVEAFPGLANGEPGDTTPADPKPAAGLM